MLRVVFRILRATSSYLSFIVSVSVLTALILSLPVMWFWPFGRTHHPTVEIDDRASILSDESVADSIRDVGFRQDVHVLVVSVPGYMIENLNGEVLRCARTHQDAP